MGGGRDTSVAEVVRVVVMWVGWGQCQKLWRWQLMVGIAVRG